MIYQQLILQPHFSTMHYKFNSLFYIFFNRLAMTDHQNFFFQEGLDTLTRGGPWKLYTSHGGGGGSNNERYEKKKSFFDFMVKDGAIAELQYVILYRVMGCLWLGSLTVGKGIYR